MAHVDVLDTSTMPAVDSWQVESMRLTAFPAEPMKTEGQSWWADLVGYDPETVVSRAKAGQYRAEGEFEGRRLSLNNQLERIDWHLAAAAKQSEEELASLPLAGPFPEVLGSFSKIANGWLGLSPAITRLAFGGVLLQPVEDRRFGYVQIGRYLPSVTLDPDGSSDFLYQINRPRPSKVGVEGLRINRLMKWSVLMFGQFRMTLQRRMITTVGLDHGDSACRLELDINTAPDFEGVLPTDKLMGIFGELVALAGEIAAKGDIP
jgi:hypothetical protein